MKILGIRYGHSAAAALIIDGKIVANVMEERFTRVKNDGSFPEKAIDYCLKEVGIDSTELDAIAFPNISVPQIAYAFFPSNEYKINYHLPQYPEKSFEKVKRTELVKKGIPKLPTYTQIWELKSDCEFWCIDHHLGHAASAYYTSGLNTEEVLIFTLDGVGDKISGTISKGQNNRIERLYTISDEGSLGWFYSTVTEALDWRHGSDEWKVMGLAPYGEPQAGLLDEFHPKFQNGELIKGVNYRPIHRWADHGTNHYHIELANEIKSRFQEFKPEDIAAETQRIAEQELFNIVLPWIHKTGIKQCCFAGGFFLNVKANQQLWYSGELEEQWVYPDPGDSGLPVGVALYSYFNSIEDDHDRLKTLYHGPSFTNDEILSVLKDRGIDYEYHEDIEKATAQLLSSNHIVGWFQGRMEAGPRALGNRSILMNPTNPDSKDIINKKVKFREAFRPFCPSLKKEVAHTYLSNPRDEYFMVTSFKSKEGVDKLIPAVIHVDETARPQMVTDDRNPRYYKLLEEFGMLTGHHVLLNTSFNVKGEPIVCTPRDAIRCFFDNGLDVLVLGNYMIKKKHVTK